MLLCRNSLVLDIMMPSREPSPSRKLKKTHYISTKTALFNKRDPNTLNIMPRQTLPSYRHAIKHTYQSRRGLTVKDEKEAIKTGDHETTCPNLKDTIDEYCVESTLHGLKYVGDKRLCLFERLFWLTAFLLATSVGIQFISALFINYHNTPVVVNFSPEMKNIQDIPFPAITICNINIATQARAQFYKLFGTPAENEVLDGLCRADAYQKSNESITWDIVENTIRNVTQLCSELMVGCKWSGKLYPCRALINSVITDDGFCCTFNKLPEKLVYRSTTATSSKATHLYPPDIVDWYPEAGYPHGITPNTYPYRSLGRGILSGLTIVLNVALDDYYCSATGGFGIKMMLHTPRESPKIADAGFLIQPGAESRIAIGVAIEGANPSVRNIDPRKRGCFYTDERHLEHYRYYNRLNCILECEANYTLKKCGCSVFYLPRKEKTKICDQGDDICVDEAKYIIERFGKEKLECDCLPGCTSIQYMPQYVSKASLQNMNNITYHDFIGNYSQEYFASNMAIVHVYYNQIRFPVLIKRTLYDFTQFVSNTGGILGLFMGFSFLSIVEMIYFIVLNFITNWYQRNKDKNVIKPFIK